MSEINDTSIKPEEPDKGHVVPMLEDAMEKVDRSGEWEPRFDAVMRKYYGRVPTDDIMAYFQREGKTFSKQFVYKMAHNLGLSKKRS